MSYQVTKPFIAALFHDIGKFYRKVLNYTNSHQKIGSDFFEEIDEEVAKVIRYHHHERDKLSLESLPSYIAKWVKNVEKADRFVSGVTRSNSDKEKSNAKIYPPWILVELKNNNEKDLRNYGFDYGLYFDFLFSREQARRKKYINILLDSLKEKLNEMKKGKITNKELYTILTFLRELTLFVQSYQQADYPHTSLYSHLYFTSTFEYLIENNIERPYLFVIEASGIQNFISKVMDKDYTSKGTARIFRGRSILIELLTELLALELIESHNLPYTLISSFSSGKIHIIIPEDKVESVKKKIEFFNNYLFENSLHPLRFNFGFAEIPLTLNDKENFSEIWKKVVERSYSSMFKNKFFIDRNFKEKEFEGLCEVCGESSNMLKEKNIGSDEDKENYKLCYACRLSFNIGKEVLKSSFGNKVVNHSFYFSFSRKFKEKCIEVRGFEIKAKISDRLEGEFNRLYPFTTKGNSYDLVEKIIREMRSSKNGFTYNYPIFNSVKLLDYFFNKNKNMNKMAFVKMDVDGLGNLYERSLNIDISKSLELSEMITFVLKNEIRETLLSKNIFVYPLYIGGDDVILGGNPRDMLYLINEINEKLNKKTNKNIRLSSSYLLVEKGAPIREVFSKLEEFIYLSKNVKNSKRNKENKDPAFSFSFMSDNANSFLFSEFKKHYNEAREFINYLIEETSKNDPNSIVKHNSLLYNLLEIRKSYHIRKSKQAKLVHNAVENHLKKFKPSNFYLNESEKAKLEYVKSKRKLDIDIPSLEGLYLSIFINKWGDIYDL